MTVITRTVLQIMTASDLSAAYKIHSLSPSAVIQDVYRRLRQENQDALWTYLVSEAEALAAAEKLEQGNAWRLPLYYADHRELSGLFPFSE
jgi:Asp-tRNA(Asn)/Glu-tRNA(Gln) amidotransferase A subunit family amidase